MDETWTLSYGNWTRGRREVNELAPGLYQARLRRSHLGQMDLADSTIYGTAKAAREAADRLS